MGHQGMFSGYLVVQLWVAKGWCGRFWELTLFLRGGGMQFFCAILGWKRVQQVLRTHPCSQLDDLCLDEKVPVLGLHRRRGERAQMCKSESAKTIWKYQHSHNSASAKTMWKYQHSTVVLVLRLLQRYWHLHCGATSANIMISNSLRTKICRSDFQQIKPFDH